MTSSHIIIKSPGSANYSMTLLASGVRRYPCGDFIKDKIKKTIVCRNIDEAKLFEKLLKAYNLHISLVRNKNEVVWECATIKKSNFTFRLARWMRSNASVSMVKDIVHLLKYNYKVEDATVMAFNGHSKNFKDYSKAHKDTYWVPQMDMLYFEFFYKIINFKKEFSNISYYSSIFKQYDGTIINTNELIKLKYKYQKLYDRQRFKDCYRMINIG